MRMTALLRLSILPKLAHLSAQAIEVGIDDRFGNAAVPQLLPDFRTFIGRDCDPLDKRVCPLEMLGKPARFRPKRDKATTLGSEPPSDEWEVQKQWRTW